jgi:acyl-CoA thioesterase FadM
VVEFQIRLIADNQICTNGRGEQAAVKHPEMEMMFEIPEEIRNALGA